MTDHTAISAAVAHLADRMPATTAVTLPCDVVLVSRDAATTAVRLLGRHAGSAYTAGDHGGILVPPHSEAELWPGAHHVPAGAPVRLPAAPWIRSGDWHDHQWLLAPAPPARVLTHPLILAAVLDPHAPAAALRPAA